MKLKRKYIVIGSVIFLLIIGIIYFLVFTSVGYVATIQFRGFTEVQDNIYIDDNYNGNTDVLSIISQANDRVENFWGDIQSRPTIIISDDEKKLAEMGWTGSPALTTTTVLFGVHSYVLISPNGLNIDVAAHELTHAELHRRLYEGKILPVTLVPTWFDEGVATQNDYREKYNDAAWLNVTCNGENITDFADIRTPELFFNKDKEVRGYNYIISKHEVHQWIEQHGVDELIAMIGKINAGKSFEDLYNAR